jgi:hypothetical protein
MSALPPEAEMCSASIDIRQGPIADIAPEENAQAGQGVTAKVVNSVRAVPKAPSW